MGLCGSTDETRRLQHYETKGAAEEGGSGEEEVKVEMLHIGHSEAINDVISLPGGMSITCSNDASIRAYNWSQNKEQQVWSEHTKAVNRLAWAGARLPEVFASCSRDLSIKLWNRSQSASLSTFNGHSLTVSSIAFANDQPLLASGSRDTSIRLWSSEGQRSSPIAVKSEPRNLVTCCQWFPQQPLLAQGAEDLKVRVWDARGGLKPAYRLEGYTYFPLDMDISDDGNYLITSTKGFNSVGCDLWVWDVRTRKAITTLAGHAQDTVGCTYLRNYPSAAASSRVVTVSKDSTVRLWDVGTASCISSLSIAEAGAFTAICEELPGNTDSAAAPCRVIATSFNEGFYVFEVSDDCLKQIAST